MCVCVCVVSLHPTPEPGLVLPGLAQRKGSKNVSGITHAKVSRDRRGKGPKGWERGEEGDG